MNQTGMCFLYHFVIMSGFQKHISGLGLWEMAVIRDLSNWQCHSFIICRQYLRAGVVTFMS